MSPPRGCRQSQISFARAGMSVEGWIDIGPAHEKRLMDPALWHNFLAFGAICVRRSIESRGRLDTSATGNLRGR